MDQLQAKLKTLPEKPGVYLFKNSAGEVLYVGKAKNLKNRVRSYFLKAAGHLPRTLLLLQEISDLDYVIVSSEVESLILENNFIKQYQPRFNVRLRDDKNYQFIKIDYDLEIPQVYPVRKIAKGKSRAKYFGPYTSALSVKQTLKLLKTIFGLCANTKVGTRPCFYYHLNRCPGVCIGKVSLASYRQTMAQVEAFLSHKQIVLMKSLRQQMQQAAVARQFEKAANLRDKMRGLAGMWEKQKIVSPRLVSQDYFSLFAAGNQAVVNLFVVRSGKLIHQENFELAATEDAKPAIIMESFLKQYYGEASDIPGEIYAAQDLPGKAALEKWLHAKFAVPRRGNKQQLLKLGEENAREYFNRNFASLEIVLGQMQTILKLPDLPVRIEAFDISNIQGTTPVGSMVVFENGAPLKSGYRKFKIQTKATPDDFGMMREMLQRRFRPKTERQALWPRPNLIIVDGGKGQLNVAGKVLQKYKLAIPLIGLAKRLEEIFVPGRKIGLILPPNSPVLFLLQRIRDEAHRFAITFYRGRHRREQSRSRLDEIPGIGPATRHKLLRRFNTLSGIRSASLEAVASEVGTRLAKQIKELL